MVGYWIEKEVIDLTVDLSKGDWHPIPGYGTRYFINSKGLVCNTYGHVIKQIPSKFGPMVEMRINGQRDRILVLDLLERIKHAERGFNETD